MKPPSFKKMEVSHHTHTHTKPLLTPTPPATMSGHHLHHLITAVEVNEPPPPPQSSLTKPPADLDETDYSTSFADTTSTNQNDDLATISDAEVESRFENDGNGFVSSFDDFGTVLRVRKKRLTSHWRNFIRPLMWRCKWAELKIMQFESLASKYAKNIAARDLTKHLGSNQSIPEGFSSRSMPYICQRRRKKLMKRRNRVKIEETADADLYMSQHYLFSYHESKKSDPEEASMMDDVDDTEQNTTNQEVFGLGMHNNWSFLEDEDNDMEHILQKIEISHSRVHKLKAQLDLVISENVQMFPSSDNLNHLVIHSPTFSTCEGDAVSVGGLGGMTRNDSEFDLAGLEMSEHEGFHIPDITESTVGILSSVDVTQLPSQIGDSCENMLENMLVHDKPIEAERLTLRHCQNQHQQQVTVKQEEGVKIEQEEESGHLNPAMESETATKDVVSQEQFTLKPNLVSEFQVPKNKRKRGERKAGSGNWSRQCPGEPDSQ